LTSQKSFCSVASLRWNYISPIFAGDEQPGQVTNLDLSTGDLLLGNLFDKYAGVKPIYDEFEPRLGLAYRLMSAAAKKGAIVADQREPRVRLRYE